MFQSCQFKYSVYNWYRNYKTAQSLKVKLSDSHVVALDGWTEGQISTAASHLQDGRDLSPLNCVGSFTFFWVLWFSLTVQIHVDRLTSIHKLVHVCKYVPPASSRPRRIRTRKIKMDKPVIFK